MEKYFGLFHNCKYAYGKNGGCIYDMLTGKMFAINTEMDMILRQALSNNKVDIDNHYLNELVENNLGEFYDSPLMSESVIDGRNTEKYRMANSTNKLERVYIQVTNECNKNCGFCDESAMIYTKTHCKKWNNKEMDISEKIWNENFEKMKFLGLSEIRFIGGNPFLNSVKMEQIISCAKKNNINQFCIYSNLELWNDSITELCKKYKIKINVQIMEWNETIKENIKSSLNVGIELEASILISKKIETNMDTIFEELRQLGIKKVNVDYLYCDSDKPWYSKRYACYLNKKTFGLVSEQSLEMYELCNNCLYGQIYINVSGDVTPCPMMNNKKIGNIINEDLYELLCKEEYQEIIHLTRNKLPGCSECAYRYNCSDCRAIEMAKSGNLYQVDYCDEINLEKD